MIIFSIIGFTLIIVAESAWCPHTCYDGRSCPSGTELVSNYCYGGQVCCKTKGIVVATCTGRCGSYCKYDTLGELLDKTKTCDDPGNVCCVKAPVTSPPVVDNGPPKEGECGTTKFDKFYNSHRIVGGREAKIGEYPWQVHIKKYRRSHCGGTILNDLWILSAAHCFKGWPKPKDYQFIVGEHDNRHMEGNEQVLTAATIIRHPKYNDKRTTNDIVLIKLNQRIKFNENVKSACMPKDGESFEGLLCTVSGWGKLAEKSLSSPVLHGVSVPIVPLDSCKKAYTHIDDYNVCGGYEIGGKDACVGDSGGPYVCKKPGQKWKIVGVVSYGDGCARPGKYGVYASVPHFYMWIKDTITKNT